MIFIDKFRDNLTTSDLQFGFIKKHSTSLCTMALNETLAYYSVDGGTAFCTFLDATKAFDRVDYCKLFRELIKRDVPANHLRLLLNTCTNSVARICWNGVFSQFFCVYNGIKHGGIVSPILYCVHVDGLLQRLRDSKIGCWIGSVYVGVLAYADDVTLLATTQELCVSSYKFVKIMLARIVLFSMPLSRLLCSLPEEM